jgi:hypothetical protein
MTPALICSIQGADNLTFLKWWTQNAIGGQKLGTFDEVATHYEHPHRVFSLELVDARG